MIVEQLVHLFAPWHLFYGDSKLAPIVTESSHVLAMLLGGGFAVAADRATLRVARKRIERRQAQLTELHEVHRPVLIALAALLVTGIALAGADVEAFVASPAFWVKLGLVVLLVANGALFVRTESRLHAVHMRADSTDPLTERLWRQMRFNSQCSLFLWSATLVAGIVLTNVA